MTTIQSTLGAPVAPLLPPSPGSVRASVAEPAAVVAGQQVVMPPAFILSSLNTARVKADALSDTLQNRAQQVQTGMRRVLVAAPVSGEGGQFAPDYLAAQAQYVKQLSSSLGSLADTDRIADRMLGTRQLGASLAGLAQSGLVPNTEQRQALESALADAAPPVAAEAEDAPPLLVPFEDPAPVRSAPPPPPSPQQHATKKSHHAVKLTIPDADIWAKLTSDISKIGDSYLHVYESVVTVYTQFYQEYTDEITAKMAGWIDASSDGNSVTIHAFDMNKALVALKTKYGFTDGPDKNKGILFPTGSNTATEAEARQWATELDLPSSCVHDIGGGKFVVSIDLGPIDAIIQSLKDVWHDQSNVSLNNAKFQSWQSGNKAQEENMKNTLQTLTQKYSNANSLYDNLVKVLSSTINTCLETAKSFLQG